MTRLFIRFYLGVLFILLTAWFVQSYVIRRSSDAENIGVVESVMAGGLRSVRDRLIAVPPDQRPSRLQEIQEDFEFDIALIDLELFPESMRKRFGKDDEVVFYYFNGGRVATELGEQEQVVSFGPLPDFAGPKRVAVLAGLGCILLLAAFAIAVLLRPVARQLREVERTASAIAGGDLSARIDTEKVPKGQQLAGAFNSMADRTEKLLRTQRELLQAVSHELRTPLARMRFAIDLIESAENDQQRGEKLRSLEACTEELDGLVGELLSYVRMETATSQMSLQEVDLTTAIQNLIAKRTPIFPEIEFDIERLQSSNISVNADAAGLQRAIGNLISNACRFANQRVRVHATETDDGVVIDVEDDGIGIPQADRERVLQPFVRLSNGDGSGHGRGVGLGLALVDRIVASHGGQVRIDKSSLGGCLFQTVWPHANDRQT